MGLNYNTGDVDPTSGRELLNSINYLGVEQPSVPSKLCNHSAQLKWKLVMTYDVIEELWKTLPHRALRGNLGTSCLGDSPSAFKQRPRAENRAIYWGCCSCGQPEMGRGWI